MLFRISAPRIAAPRFSPGDRIEVGGHPVRLAVNARASRVSLRLDTNRREIIATAPSQRGLKDAVAFAQSRAPWIAAQLDDLPDRMVLAPGEVINLGGEPCRLERAAMRIKPRLIAAREDEPARLVASGDGEAFARAVIRGLKAEALARTLARTEHYASRLDQPMPEVSVIDARARWGSCRPASKLEGASIRYVWRLILAPDFVLDYVAAHESAHLIEANHGPRFWALVKSLYGDHRPAREWLKRHGAELHSVGP